jgi:hypothetical protein
MLPRWGWGFLTRAEAAAVASGAVGSLGGLGAGLTAHLGLGAVPVPAALPSARSTALLLLAVCAGCWAAAAAVAWHERRAEAAAAAHLARRSSYGHGRAPQ